MATPQVYQAFVNGGFREVVLTADLEVPGPALQVASLYRTIDKLQEQLQVSRLACDLTSGYYDRVKEELRIAKEAHERQAASIRGYQARIKDLENTPVNGLVKRNSELQAQVSALRGNNDRQAETIKQFMADKEKLGSELEAAEQHVTNLRHENGKFNITNASLWTENSRLNTRLREAEHTLAESKRSGSLAQLDKLNERLHTAEFQRDKAVAANGRQAETLKMLMRDNETLHSNNRELESRVKFANEYIAMLKRAANVAVDELTNVL